MKMTKILISLILTLLFLIAAPTSLAASSVTFTGTTTFNSFGKDGIFMPPLLQSTPTTPAIPSYATFNSTGANPWNWPPWCWYSGASFSFSIGITDGKTHQVTLWLLDQDRGSRVETISITDPISGSLLDTRSASNFPPPGQYLSWVISGNVNIRVTYNAGSNAVVSGIYFDPAPSTITPPPPPNCPTPTHSAILNWQPSTSSNIIGYNIYQNGTKITPSPIQPPYTITGLTAGASIVFNVTSVNVSGESAFAIMPSLTVPSP